MFAIMPQTPPSFSFGRSGHQGQHNHRPAFTSPLSSSPIRASSASPPPYHQQHHHHHHQTTSQPLSPCDSNHLNTLHRETQSSPILGKSVFGPSDNSFSASNNSSNKFRFASRNPRPNPLLKRREDAQEGRRRLFFQNVRQRQEEKRWEMRGGEDELLKLEWWRLNRERLQAKEAEVAEYMGSVDADVVAREEEELHRMLERDGEDVDAMMADVIAQQEEAEVDALVSALEGQSRDGDRNESAQFSDDEDYDGLFMDLIRSQQQPQGMAFSEDVEMS